MTTSAYAITVTQLEATYDRTVESCRRQAIRKIGICASMTGKLMGELEQMTRMRRRLELDGIDVFGMVYPIGHPAMGATYGGRTEPPDPLPFYAGGGVESEWRAAARLPVGWHYAVNEFGFPVFNCACPDDACVAGNARVTRLVARVFDEVWLDDDFRVDGDQGAGTPTAARRPATASVA